MNEEDEALAYVPDPFGGKDACEQLANVTRLLRAQRNWRMSDLNPDSPGYAGRVKRIAIINTALARLERAHRDVCGKDCPNYVE
jgi:hypothetical protein